MQKIIVTLAFASMFTTAAFGVNPIAAVADPSTSAAGLVVQYQSPFKDYRPLGEDKRIPWKKANDDVGKIGGWRVYARENSNNAVDEPKPAVPTGNPESNAAPAVKGSPPAVDKSITAPIVKPAAKPTSEPNPMQNKGHASHGQPK